MPNAAPNVRYGTSQARWIIAATALGSGIAFLDSTVVNVALPTIGRELGTSIGGLQWTVNAYLITLAALILLGGSFGDRFGRRAMFIAGLAGFTVASLLCSVAPNIGLLIVGRALQGVGGALLVPGSMAIIASTFHPDDRGRAVGAWSGLAGVASSIGPFVGGWLIDASGWRLIFVINVPLAAVAIGIAIRHVPETRAPHRARFDGRGSVLIALSFASFSYAAIDHSGSGAIAAAAVGAVTFVGFLREEKASTHPMLPLNLFRSRQFTGSNLTTLAVYAGLGGTFFFVVLRLQVSLGYSALKAGAALTPFTIVMLVLSPGAGRLSQRIGPRIPMTVGPLVASAGLALFSRVSTGDRYLTNIMPAVLVFGLGMAITVAPLTTAVLSSVTDEFTGVASAVNNVVARFAGLVAVATLPAVTGLGDSTSVRRGLDGAYSNALLICAASCAFGGTVAALLVRTSSPFPSIFHPSPFVACLPETARPSSSSLHEARDGATRVSNSASSRSVDANELR